MKVHEQDERWGMKKRKSNGLKVVDLFCGAGVGAVGIREAGYEIVYAIDNKKYAVDTYNQNIGNHAVLGDIRKLSAIDLPQADLYAGGFPCQPFSLGGKGEGEEDEKLGDLAKHFYRLVKEGRPKAFLIENVGGILTKNHKDFFLGLIELFRELGYNVSWEYLNCHDYGVPQLRKRVFAIGIRQDIEGTFKFPEKLPEELRTTIYDAIGDLPDPNGEKIVNNHDKYYEGGFSSRYKSRNRQKQWNEPSFTIVSQPRQLPLHPEPPHYDIRIMDTNEVPPPRRFTVRECLRLQTVPDWFSFSDEIDLTKQYERCSGIPSLMAYKLGIEIEKIINEKE